MRQKWQRLPNWLRITVVAASLIVLLVWVVWVMRSLVNPPDETSTPALLSLLVSLVLLGSVVVFIGLRSRSLKSPDRRFAFAGVILLCLGVVLAAFALPESDSTGALSGGVGVLPPYPARESAGFTLGLAARPKGCRDPVPITIVVSGSSAYWAHAPHPNSPQRFALVLPGHLKPRVGLGSLGSPAVSEPDRAEVDDHAHQQITKLDITYPSSPHNHRDLTVITGYVVDWANTQRPLIITTPAPWITHRGITDCNLELPALSGGTSTAALVEAFTCPYLDRKYAQWSCSQPSSAADAAPGVMDVSPSLEASEAVSVITGSNVSSSESDPQPATVDGTPTWRCDSGASTVQIQGGEEVGEASVVGQGDCHAVATVLLASWHRDLLLALIGAFLAVGVHMMFEAMVEHKRKLEEQT
jgi:hypothetical protein